MLNCSRLLARRLLIITTCLTQWTIGSAIGAIAQENLRVRDVMARDGIVSQNEHGRSI
jgi:hypothetical protein